MRSSLTAGRSEDLRGLTALVTGSTSGIGRAAADCLARDGAEVIVHGRSTERGEGAVAEIIAAGGHARFVAADLGDVGEVRRLAEDAGEVDILVNNAGFSYFAPTPDLDIDNYNKLFDDNVRAPFFLVAALAPGMAARGHGSIINISSMAGLIGLPGGAAYGATKASLDAFTRAWAAEYGPQGVRVNAIAPGPILTEGAIRELTVVFGESTPLGRAAESTEVGEIVAFLASPRASYIHGATLPADGGRTVI